MGDARACDPFGLEVAVCGSEGSGGRFVKAAGSRGRRATACSAACSLHDGVLCCGTELWHTNAV
jgi:hypothetical protein